MSGVWWAARAQALGRLQGLAEGQGGLFTRAQAQASGVSDQVLARHQSAGRIRRVVWGVYGLTGGLGCYERVRAAWLQLDGGRASRRGEGQGPAGVVSHLAAAVFDLCPEPDQLTFTVLGRAAGAELVGDLLDGVGPSAVGAPAGRTCPRQSWPGGR